MGDVIQMFKADQPAKDFDPLEVLTEELQDELAAITYEINALWKCTTEEDFKAQMAAIKEQVAGWPDG